MNAKKNKYVSKLICAFSLLCWLFASGCGAKNSSAPMPASTTAPWAEIAYDIDENASRDAYYGDEKIVDGAEGSQNIMSGGEAAPPEESAAYAGPEDVRPDKIIKSGYVSLETNIFDDCKANIENFIKSEGGYTEFSNLYGQTDSRQFEATFRVPAEKFDIVKQSIESMGRLLSSNESQSNLSAEYYDTQARLEAKKLEEDRLLEMISKASDVNTLLALEQYLAQVRTDIEIHQSQIKNIDSRSSYSTLSVSLTEQVNARLTTGAIPFGLRMSNSFVNSVNNTITFFENAMVFLAGAALPLLFAAVLIMAALFAFRAAVKKHRARIEGRQ